MPINMINCSNLVVLTCPGFFQTISYSLLFSIYILKLKSVHKMQIIFTCQCLVLPLPYAWYIYMLPLHILLCVFYQSAYRVTWKCIQARVYGNHNYQMVNTIEKPYSIVMQITHLNMRSFTVISNSKHPCMPAHLSSRHSKLLYVTLLNTC